MKQCYQIFNSHFLIGKFCPEINGSIENGGVVKNRVTEKVRNADKVIKVDV